MITIQNENLTATFAARGAELTSLIDAKGQEWLWTADPRYWAWHAPLLFPIVGRLKDDQYRIAGQTYTLPRHGFARQAEFQLIEHTPTTAIFRLTASEESLKNYPFNFQLDILYELNANQLEVGYRVANLDTTVMPFSIGAHPAFRVPRNPEEQFSDYFLEFAEPQTLQQIPLLPSGLLARQPIPFGTAVQTIALDKEFFQNDAVILTGFTQYRIALCSKNDTQSLVMDFPGFPHLGIWSKPDAAPFVCLEPWFGHADFEDFTGELSQKPGIINLEPGQQFTSQYTIQIKSNP